MYDFPNSPTLNQVFGSYTWDGQKWAQTPGLIAATALPLMDGTPAAVGASNRYAREDHVHPVDTAAVRTEQAQALTAAQQIQARTNIYAAPFDAMAYNGMQINGSMEVNQEHPSVVAIAPGAYVADVWVFGGPAGTHAYTNNTIGPPGIPNGIYVTADSTAITVAPTTLYRLYQAIEGYRLSRLGFGSSAAQPVTVAFWSSCTDPGQYSVALSNADGTRTCAIAFTQAVGNAPQYNVVKFPGCTDGTWNTTTAVGAYLSFTFAAGSTYIAPAAGVWNSTNYVAAPGQSNGGATLNHLCSVTGVLVLPGTEAPSSARSPFIMRPYDQELRTCQRYWEKIGGTAPADIYVSGYLPVVGTMPFPLFYPTEMRAVPTAAVAGSWSFANCAIASLNGIGTKSLGLNVTALAAGQFTAYTTNTTCFISLDARL